MQNDENGGHDNNKEEGVHNASKELDSKGEEVHPEAAPNYDHQQKHPLRQQQHHVNHQPQQHHGMQRESSSKMAQMHEMHPHRYQTSYGNDGALLDNDDRTQEKVRRKQEHGNEEEYEDEQHDPGVVEKDDIAQNKQTSERMMIRQQRQKHPEQVDSEERLPSGEGHRHEGQDEAFSKSPQHHARLREPYEQVHGAAENVIDQDQLYFGPANNQDLIDGRSTQLAGRYPMDFYSVVALVFAIGGFVVIVLLLFTPNNNSQGNDLYNEKRDGKHHKKKKLSPAASRKVSGREGVHSRRSIKKKQDDYYYESDYEPNEEDGDEDPTHEMFDDSLDDLISFQKEQMQLQQQQQSMGRMGQQSTLTHRAAAKSGTVASTMPPLTPSRRLWAHPPQQLSPKPPPPPRPPPPVVSSGPPSSSSDSDSDGRSSAQSRPTTKQRPQPEVKPSRSSAPQHAGLSGFLSPPTALDGEPSEDDHSDFEYVRHATYGGQQQDTYASPTVLERQTIENPYNVVDSTVRLNPTAGGPKRLPPVPPHRVVQGKPDDEMDAIEMLQGSMTHLDTLLVESDAEEDDHSHHSGGHRRPKVYYQSSSNDEFEFGGDDDDEVSVALEQGEILLTPPSKNKLKQALGTEAGNMFPGSNVSSSPPEVPFYAGSPVTALRESLGRLPSMDGVVVVHGAEHGRHRQVPVYTRDTGLCATSTCSSVSVSENEEDRDGPTISTHQVTPARRSGKPPSEPSSLAQSLKVSPSDHCTTRTMESSGFNTTQSTVNTQEETPRIHNAANRTIRCLPAKSYEVEFASLEELEQNEHLQNVDQSPCLPPAQYNRPFETRSSQMERSARAAAIGESATTRGDRNDATYTPPVEAFVPFLPSLSNVGDNNYDSDQLLDPYATASIEKPSTSGGARSHDSEFSFAMPSDDKPLRQEQYYHQSNQAGEEKQTRQRRKMSNEDLGDYMKSQVRLPESPFAPPRRVIDGSQGGAVPQGQARRMHMPDPETLSNHSRPDSVEDEPGVKHVRTNLVQEDSDASASLSGYIKFNDLNLSEIVGGGGFGQVYKATWYGTPVAVKVINTISGVSPSKKVLEEFAAEINLLSGMRHPNICLYIGACLEPPNFAIVTELASNGSLWDALRLPINSYNEAFAVCNGWNHDGWPQSLYATGSPHPRGSSMHIPIPPAGTWPWALVKKVASGAARGMTYLHGGTPPVLHRDLKSANLLLDESYNAKVCDFGLSRLKAQERSMTGNCGTVQWMAPEVLANERYAEPADVFSFGVILWELLSRECPYDGMDPIPCALAVLNKHERPSIPLWCPPAFATLIRKCWDQDPTVRPTFMQVLSALDAMP
jgi:hypothetical protein